jgi:hypothetical protein
MPVPDEIDDRDLEILALYEMGCTEEEVARMTGATLWEVCAVISMDAAEFPDEPLRERVLH